MKTNRLQKMLAIVSCLVILTIGGVLINQIGKNHQANNLIIEKCFDNVENGGTVVLGQKNLWSPVTCESTGF